MSITTQRNSNSDLIDAFDRAVIRMADSYVNKKRFGLGSGYNQEDFQKMKRLEKIICRGSCGTDSELFKKAEEQLNKLSKKYM